jgi:hypothetical protein
MYLKGWEASNAFDLDIAESRTRAKRIGANRFRNQSSHEPMANGAAIKNKQFNQKKKKTNYEHWKHKAQMRKGVLEFCILSVLKEKMPTHRKY